MSYMFSLSSREYKDVIKICCTVVVQCIIKDVINIVLERSQGVIKAKQRHQYLIEPKAGNKYYQPLMAFGDTDPIKRSNNVKLNIELGAIQGIKCLMDEREQVSILNGNIIQSLIVIADPYPSFWFSGKQEQGYYRGR